MKLSKAKLIALKKLFKKYSQIKVVYLFGSHARGDADSASDYDFALYVDPAHKNKAFEILLKLSSAIGAVLHTDNYDVVVINLIDNLILKNNIVNQGIVLYEISGYRINLEVSIVGEYRDFRILESQYYSD
jgi:predicted nucleotidyltransferase